MMEKFIPKVDENEKVELNLIRSNVFSDVWLNSEHFDDSDLKAKGDGENLYSQFDDSDLKAKEEGNSPVQLKNILPHHI